MSGAPFLAVEGLGRQHQPGVWALRDVSFSLSAGSFCCLAGANGGGKSTLLALLAGLFEPSEGRLLLNGQSGVLRERASLLLQDADLQILGATVREDLLLGLPPGGDPGPALALAQRLGLDSLLDEPAHTLSYGQKRKLCLATALLSPVGKAPELLLYDEPCSGLDYPGVREWRMLAKANRAAGLTQIVATHDLDPVVDLVDTLLVLDQGRLVLNGTPAETLDGLARHGVRPPCSWLAGMGLRSWE
jgi:biotin transport system ATP-binding protein